MLDAISKCQLDLLQELLEINYFFWPEDAPFKLSPRVLVAAARADDMQALYLLVQIDPTSLPRSEENLQSVARDLQDHSDNLGEHCSQMRQQRRNLEARGKIYSERELRRTAKSVSFGEYAKLGRCPCALFPDKMSQDEQQSVVA